MARGFGSVLSDLRSGARFQPRPTPTSGVGIVQSPQLGPQSVSGEHYAQTRVVVPFSFDDSIDPTHPLDCFFQMPAGVLKLYSAKVWVKPAPFRAYETATSGDGGSSGGSSTTSSGGSSHSHNIGTAPDTVTTATGVTTDAQGVHDHSDPQGGLTGVSVSHSHNVNNHAHGYNMPVASSSADTAHTHTVSTAHTHASHSHGITYGIFESAASTGTLGLYVANDGVTFGAEVASAASISTDIRAHLTTLAGDRQIRVTTTGAGALARVKVLLILDVLIKVDIS